LGNKRLMESQTFRNPKPDLVALLEASGPAGDANGVRGSKGDAAKKKSRNRDKNVSLIRSNYSDMG
jgi:hypothetical protein